MRVLTSNLTGIFKGDSFVGFMISTFIFSAILLYFMPAAYFEGDVHWWIEWSKNIQMNGFAAAYTDPVLNYQPGILYLLQVYVWLCPASLETSISVLKSLIFVFDVGSVLVVAYLLTRYHRSPYLSWFILFNPAFLYNTFLWGQIDSMYMFFCLLSLVFVIFNKPYWAIAAFAFSIMMKPQAIFLGPFLPLLFSGWLMEEKKRIVKSLVVFCISILLICSPFIFHGQGMRLIELTFGAVDRLPSISMHAYNSWYLFFPGKDLVWEPDSMLFLGWKLRTWGFILFTVALAFTLKPFVTFFINPIFSDRKELLHLGSATFLGAAAVNLVFFYFNTQMHERYIHAAILFVGIAAILQKKYLTYLLISFAYFLSLDLLMHHCRFPEAVYKAILPYNPLFISVLFLGTLVLLWRDLQRFSSKEWMEQESRL